MGSNTGNNALLGLEMTLKWSFSRHFKDKSSKETYGECN